MVIIINIIQAYHNDLLHYYIIINYFTYYIIMELVNIMVNLYYLDYMDFMDFNLNNNLDYYHVIYHLNDLINFLNTNNN